MRISCLLLLLLASVARTCAAEDAAARLEALEKQVAALEKKGVDPGDGKLKIHTHGQVWYTADERLGNLGNAQSPGDPGFRLRRAQVRVRQSLGKKAYYYAMFDLARVQAATNLNGTSFLQDFTIGHYLRPGLELRLGQERIPTSEEALHPAMRLDLPERWGFARVFGVRRDIGLSLHAEGPERKLEYIVGIYNGNNQGALDNNGDKDLGARTVWHPEDALQIGAFYYRGRQGADLPRAPKDRRGLDFAWQPGRFALKAELFAVQDQIVATATERARNVDALGWMASAAWYLVPDKVMAIARYEDLDPDRSRAGEAQTAATPGGVTYAFSVPGQQNGNTGLNEERDLTLGVNWFLDGYNRRVSLSYTWRDETGPEIPNDVAIVNYQICF